MRRLPVLLVMLSLLALCGAETLTFEQPSIEYRDGYAIVRMPGAAAWGEEGEPQLPAVGYRSLLDWGEEAVGLSVEHGQPVRIPLDAPVMPTQRMYPLSQLDQIGPVFTEPNAEAYSQAQCPASDYAALKTSRFRGYDIAGAVVFPVVYLPSEQALLYYPELTVNVETSPSTRSTVADAMVRDDDQTMRKLAEMVDDTAAAWTYPVPATRTRDMAEYVIITDEDFVDEFQPLADYKTGLGYVTSIVTVQSILSNFTGADDQEKIRNFIIDAYLNNGLVYILLAGDDEIIPHRGFIVDIGGGYTDDDIPSDLYYFGLDGNWNDNGDFDWGEWNEADFYADVYGGRAPVDSELEAETFVYKQLMYQQSPVEEDLTEDLLLGEDLGWVSWGMDYMEEVRLGGTYNGYTTVGIPNHINVSTLYDLQGVWSLSQLFSELNAGQNLVGHLGHCNTHYNIKFDTSDVNTTNFTNNGINHNFYIVYTQGCYCNAFDNRDTSGYHSPEDAISEQWTLLPTGPVCYIGNTRYGWGDGSGTDGPSQHMHRDFYDALYGENITVISEAHEDSRVDTQPFLSPNTTLLWSYYECTLIGDPTLDVWSNQPQPVTLTVPEVLPVGSTSVPISVASSDVDVAGMRVSVLYDGELLAFSELTATGHCEIAFNPLPNIGEMTVALSGHNIHDTYETILVISPQSAYMLPDEIELSDGGDGMAAWNEEITLDVTAGNVGQQAASDVVATLTSDCEYVSLLTDMIEFGDVASEATATSDSGFVFQTCGDFPDSVAAEFTITFTSGDEEWEYDYTCLLHAPVFTMNGEAWYEVNGNGNGALDPGETLEPLMTITNDSAVGVEAFSLTVTTDNPGVTIVPETLQWSNVAAGEILDLTDITVVVGEDVMPLSVVQFYLHIESDRDFAQDRIASVSIEALTDAFESAQCTDRWTHHDIVGSAEQWHRSDANNHTTGGEWSWKCGDDGDEDYANSQYGVLESEPFYVQADAALTFWHWMDAESSTAHPGYAYDGGFVEISNDDGVTWTQLIPDGGYPYVSRGTTNLLPADTPMWSGQIDWSEVYMSLGDYAGDDCKIRFVFASDGGVNMTGWFVDDVRVAFERPLAPPEDLSGDFDAPFCTVSWVGPNCSVDCYIVRRDGVVVDENVTSNTFVDDLTGVTAGQVTYTVATVLGGEVSAMSEPLVVFVAVAGSDVPGPDTALYGNHPNPFNPETRISFSLATAQNVELKIYNVRGQLVRTLLNDHLEAGAHDVLWRGEDNLGRQTASGLYFVRMQAGDKTFTSKMLLLK